MEKVLIKGLIEGSYKSYTALYDMWVSDLYRFIYSFVKSSETTQEIVQDTFIKIWTNRANIDIQQSFKAYLFTISYHIVLKEFRYKMNHPQMEDYMEYCNDLVLSDTPIDKKVSFDNFLFELQQAKSKLTPRQRQIFEMSKEENLPIIEIAEQLSLTEQSTRNQLSAALKLIRKELKHYTLFLALFC